MTGRTIPNFFLIGPPKAGTTAVAETLSKHPEIFISDPKEPDFFVYQGGNPYGWDAKGKDSLDWYLGLFEAARSHTAVGDASPYYICCYHVAEQIYFTCHLASPFLPQTQSPGHSLLNQVLVSSNVRGRFLYSSDVGKQT